MISNTCQDSLLAIPLIFDLVILTELFTRVQCRKEPSASNADTKFENVYCVLSLLSSMLSKLPINRSPKLRHGVTRILMIVHHDVEAPLVKPGTDVVNGAARQRAAIDHFLRALIGLQPLTEWDQAKVLA